MFLSIKRYQATNLISLTKKFCGSFLKHIETCKKIFKSFYIENSKVKQKLSNFKHSPQTLNNGKSYFLFVSFTNDYSLYKNYHI